MTRVSLEGMRLIVELEPGKEIGHNLLVVLLQLFIRLQLIEPDHHHGQANVLSVHTGVLQEDHLRDADRHQAEAEQAGRRLCSA